MAAFISKIFAGEFNQRIKLKSLNATQDAFGGISSTYTTHTTIWANKNVKSLRDVKEKFEGYVIDPRKEFIEIFVNQDLPTESPI